MHAIEYFNEIKPKFMLEVERRKARGIKIPNKQIKKSLLTLYARCIHKSNTDYWYEQLIQK